MKLTDSLSTFYETFLSSSKIFQASRKLSQHSPLITAIPSQISQLQIALLLLVVPLQAIHQTANGNLPR
jgi:hypothetical protein